MCFMWKNSQIYMWLKSMLLDEYVRNSQQVLEYLFSKRWYSWKITYYSGNQQGKVHQNYGIVHQIQ